jgi:DNA-binding protein HU-beta
LCFSETRSKAVAIDTTQPKAVAEAIVRGALARIEGAVGKGETVNLVGFGRFEVHERSARRGGNLRIGESLKIPATRVVRFKDRQASSGGRCLIETQAHWAGREVAVATTGELALHTERIPGSRCSPQTSSEGALKGRLGVSLPRPLPGGFPRSYVSRRARILHRERGRERQRGHELTGGGEVGVGDGGPDRWDAGLANPGRAILGWDDVHLDLGHAVNPQDFEGVVVGLDHRPSSRCAPAPSTWRSGC